MLYPSIFNDNLFDNWFDDDFFWPAFEPDLKRLEREERKAEKEQQRADKRVFGRHAQNLMKTDVKETDDSYLVAIDLPGFKKEEVTCELKDGYLTVSAAKSEDNKGKETEGKFLRRERYSGSVKRSYYVGEEVTEDEIKAKFEHGVLKLKLPKKEAQKKVEETKHLVQIEG